MSTERDASAGATGPTTTRQQVRPRLTPPPRVVAPPPATTGPVAASPPARPAVKRSAATWLTVAFFGVLALAALAVFVVLPDWVRARQGSAQPELAQVRGEAPPAASESTLRSEPEQMQAGRLRSQQEAQQEPEAGRPRSQQETAEAPAAQPAPEIIAVPSPAAPPESPPAAPRPAATPRGNADFQRAMSEGLAALDGGDYTAAREAFAHAAALEPGSPQSADGLARAEAGARLATIRDLRGLAQDLERREDWRTAAERYQAVLELDPAVGFAQDGLDRSRRRAKLAGRLDFHLANLKRLSSDEVLAEATMIVEAASEIDPAGPKLRRQTDGLAQAVAAFSTPVTATLESDQLTEVMVYKVGRLGSFSRHVLDLRPGTYTVVGSRRGFRDVRRQLVIEPGVEPGPLVVRCEEKI